MTTVPRTTATDAVILTALAVEFQAFQRQLAASEEYRHRDGTVYSIGTLEREGATPIVVAISQTGTGNVAAAIETVRAVQEFGSGLLLFVGVAGGVKDVGIGDVVAASKIYGYESGKASDAVFSPRPETVNPSYRLVQASYAIQRNSRWTHRIRNDVPMPDLMSFVGPIAAGEKVVAGKGSQTAEFLAKYYSDTLAVEMEGFGAMRAASQFGGLEYTVIRGISDLLSGKADADARGSQSLAAANAAAFAAALLEQVVVSAPPSKDQTQARELRATLTALLSELYPEGPRQRAIWERAGGSIAFLDLAGEASTVWFRALGLVMLGGGGKLSVRSLVGECLSDFPNHSILATIDRTLRES